MSPLPSSILVVRLGAIGDVVNALVFATAIKDAAPDTRIGWAVHPLAAPLVEDHPSVDRVHRWERGQGLGAWRRICREVREQRYELAVDLQRLFKSALLARASRAPRVLGFDRARTKEMSWLLTGERIAPGPARSHRVDQYMEVARHLGVRDTEPRHLLPTDPEAKAWARERVGRLGAKPVLLNLGASKPDNRWPAERFGELARVLARDLDAPVVFIGGPGDRAAAEEAGAVAGSAAVDWVGETSLRQLIPLMDESRLFVGADTGPMHLAAARRLPVLALFGPADPLCTGPWGTSSEVLRTPPLMAGIPFTPASMGNLSVDQVAAAARTLDESSGRGSQQGE